MFEKSTHKIVWKRYNQELISRGMLTIWIHPEVLKNWIAPIRRKEKSVHITVNKMRAKIYGGKNVESPHLS